MGACWSFGSCGVNMGLVGVLGVAALAPAGVGALTGLSLGLWVNVWGLG